VSPRLPRAFRALFATSLSLALREPVALFWNVVAPAFILVAFASVFGAIPHAIGWITAGLLSISAMGTALFGVSTSLVNQREQRILRRYGATPVPALAIVLAELATGAVLALIASGLQLALAAALFGLPIVDRLARVAPILLVGIVAFMAIGLLVGTLCTSPRTALVAGNALFLPFLFLGGAAIPLPVLPSSVTRFSLLLPSRHLVDALARVLVRGATLAEVAGPLLLLAATAVLGIAFATLLFRFDPEEKLPITRAVAPVVALVVLFAIPAFAREDRGAADFSPARAAASARHEPLVVDDFADGDLEAGTLGRWTAFTDRIPLLLGTSDASLENVADASAPAGRALHVHGRVTRDARFGGFAGASLALADADGHALDLSGFRAIRLRVRGDGGSFRLVLPTPPLTDFDHLSFWFDAPAEWRTLEAPLSAFAQASGATPREGGLERTLALQILTAGAPRASFELWIADVVLLP
jgi:ABC-2 type transport system permease protein